MYIDRYTIQTKVSSIQFIIPLGTNALYGIAVYYWNGGKEEEKGKGTTNERVNKIDPV